MKPAIDKDVLQMVSVERNENKEIHVKYYGDITEEERRAFLGIHIGDEIRQCQDMGYTKQQAYDIIDIIVNSVKCAIDFNEAWEVEENESNC